MKELREVHAMPGAIHNYWLGIMALAFVLALIVWIGLVFNAGRHPGGKAQESWPRREVMGGSFTAMEGGRQVMPDPRESPEPDETTVPQPAVPQPAVPAAVPEPRGEAEPAEPAAHPAGSETSGTAPGLHGCSSANSRGSEQNTRTGLT
jgi:hypothetical protein